MQTQFDFSGAQLRDAGIETAIKHADQSSDKWSDRAYQLLIQFLLFKKRFMAEEVRTYANELDFDTPQSARAWGGVISRAAREFLIIKVGICQVKNPKAHMANAAMWERNDERMIENGLM